MAICSCCSTCTLICSWTLDPDPVHIRAWVCLIAMGGALSVSHQDGEHAVLVCEQIGRAVVLCHATHIHDEHLDGGMGDGNYI
jgi:hypothetical protein